MKITISSFPDNVKVALYVLFAMLLTSLAYLIAEGKTAGNFKNLGSFRVFAENDYYVFNGFNPSGDFEQLQVNFIKRFYRVAIAEHEKFGILPSVKLAQGLLESAAGTSILAKKANNYFGIKCFSRSCKAGHCINKTDDSHKDFFRKYETAWYSFRAHSQLLAGGKYRDCIKKKSALKVCECLDAKGYATNKSYSLELYALIKKFKLEQFDNFRT